MLANERRGGEGGTRINVNVFGEAGSVNINAHNSSHPGQATAPCLSELSDVVKVLHAHYERYSANHAEFTQALHYYIDPECTLLPITTADDEKHRQHLQREVIKPFIEGRSPYERPLLLLQGDSGAGKSLFTYWLESALWQAYVKDSSQPIPIRIELKPHVERDALPKAALLTRHLAYLGISDEGIRSLRAERTVIIFDGLDEYASEPHNLYQKNNLSDWKARVL